VRLRSPVIESNEFRVDFEHAAVASNGRKNACVMLTNCHSLHERLLLTLLVHPNDYHGERKFASAPGHWRVQSSGIELPLSRHLAASASGRFGASKSQNRRSGVSPEPPPVCSEAVWSDRPGRVMLVGGVLNVHQHCHFQYACASILTFCLTL